MAVEPRIVHRPEQHYAGVVRTITPTTYAAIADRIPEILGMLGSRGIALVGAPFLKYEVIDPDGELVVAAGVPVADPPPAEGDIHPATLPAGRFVVVHHTGHPDELPALTEEVLRWGGDQDLRWDMTHVPEGERWGCRTESFLTNPMEQPDMNLWSHELAFRLAD
ncbi:GyrI-like domain-containing protein [Amycolatopsis antarctica]|uniref:GyrI-like domain-containing protein n=1 Tax=Amycolatopsis antarctica TaxID=1854586 RepID=A0A263D328_9PSEU|nr:GyrI-like domain-containing protein [Amycolatopsis antarctica]OZM71765.1 GyrI-like domain-containing protein [Amycolatopsis antarctica]